MSFMMTRSLVLAAAALALAAVATPAGAEEVRLTQPIHARTLNAGNVDMVVYYTEIGADAEVVATYAARGEDYNPQRLVMRLAAGDDVRFGLPGQRGTLYRFAHDGEAVIVETLPARRTVALAD